MSPRVREKTRTKNPYNGAMSEYTETSHVSEHTSRPIVATKPMLPMNSVDLFSGIGASHRDELRRRYFTATTVFLYAQPVKPYLSSGNSPDATIVDDVSDLNVPRSWVSKVDLITMGFPCCGFSSNQPGPAKRGALPRRNARHYCSGPRHGDVRERREHPHHATLRGPRYQWKPSWRRATTCGGRHYAAQGGGWVPRRRDRWSACAQRGRGCRTSTLGTTCPPGPGPRSLLHCATCRLPCGRDALPHARYHSAARRQARVLSACTAATGSVRYTDLDAGAGGSCMAFEYNGPRGGRRRARPCTTPSRGCRDPLGRASIPQRHVRKLPPGGLSSQPSTDKDVGTGKIMGTPDGNGPVIDLSSRASVAGRPAHARSATRVPID
jgi:hypothetical protein